MWIHKIISIRDGMGVTTSSVAVRLATAVRFGNRLAPLVVRHLTGQKGLGRPLRQPRVGPFLRAEGYSRRCCHFEFIAAKHRI